MSEERVAEETAEPASKLEPSAARRAEGEDLVFAALGGLGEIGMNVAVYGYGRAGARDFILVDVGLTFGGDETPGVDLVLPDLSALKSLRGTLHGVIITHAHEDHIGALVDLWPTLRCPIYLTRFAAGLLEARRLSEKTDLGVEKPDLRVFAQGDSLTLGAFKVETIPVSHSIPESCALALHTPAGTVLHTGDWKLDKTPLIGLPTDEARLKALGEAGLRAMVCDSTNIFREGESASEADVAKTMIDLIGRAAGRVVVTTFASNIARIRGVAEAAHACGRSVIIMGRAMERALAAAEDCGYLQGLPDFLGAENWDSLPRDKIVALATGSQGEPRAMMAKFARKEHPRMALAPGDTVIFSSRTIPGNERAVGAVINGLVDQHVAVITSQTELVHVSGHPRRGELAKLYDWVKPAIVIPAHGEAWHLAEHARFAREQGVKTVILARNGDIVRLSGDAPGVVGKIATGRRYKDGDILLSANESAVDERRKLSFGGIVSIALALTAKGDVIGTPDIVSMGLPLRDARGMLLDELIEKTVDRLLDALPRPLKRDADKVIDAVEKGVRGAINQVWGKKPTVHVLIVDV